MVKSSILLLSVLALSVYIIIGFVVRKFKKVGESFATNLSLYVIYIAQAAKLLHSFIVEFNIEILIGIAWTFLFAFLAHALFYILSLQLYKKAPEQLQKVLRFGLVFSNVGYMGIPIINDVFGPDYIIYATIYVVMFNVFCFSVGRLIYTGDKKYMSVKSMIINPAVIPIIIGFVIFITGLGGNIRNVIEAQSGVLSSALSICYDVLTTLKNTVAPASMLVIGCRLADIKFGSVFKDKYLYSFLAIRHFIFPFIIWAIMRAFNFFGIFNNVAIIGIVLIVSSTPAGAATTMFAELYGGDSVYASKIVAISTIFSIISMPLIANLLLI